MYQITRLSEKQGLTAPGTSERILEALNIYGLPHACGLPLSDLTETITLDKKNLGGKLNIVLLHSIGDSYVYPASVDFFIESNENLIV